MYMQTFDALSLNGICATLLNASAKASAVNVRCPCLRLKLLALIFFASLITFSRLVCGKKVNGLSLNPIKRLLSVAFFCQMQHRPSAYLLPVFQLSFIAEETARLVLYKVSYVVKFVGLGETSVSITASTSISSTDSRGGSLVDVWGGFWLDFDAKLWKDAIVVDSTRLPHLRRKQRFYLDSCIIFDY